MSHNQTSLEPPSKCACRVDVQCHYADINVPGDQLFSQWVQATISYLIQSGSVDNTEIEVFILIVDKTESQLLNAQYRQINKPTNVLSFPFDTPDIFKQHQQVKILGDIVICAPVIELEANQQHKSLQQHWAHMLVHGVLHLLGYDHLTTREAEIMETLEIKILSDLGYPDPYLETPL